MYFFFDESGDYAFPSDRFDSYVQAALICPDSQLSAVTTFVPHPRNVMEPGHLPDPEDGLFVPANFFTTLGIRPLLGRGFSAYSANISRSSTCQSDTCPSDNYSVQTLDTIMSSPSPGQVKGLMVINYCTHVTGEIDSMDGRSSCFGRAPIRCPPKPATTLRSK